MQSSFVSSWRKVLPTPLKRFKIGLEMILFRMLNYFGRKMASQMGEKLCKMNRNLDALPL
jgi:hypothetical protein